MALPTPIELLNSILVTLTTTSTSLDCSSTSKSSSSNPFRTLPNSHRALLTTLHVLLPSSTLLQAFDLLDRGLVTRISLLHEDGCIEKQQQESMIQPETQTASKTSYGQSNSMHEDKSNSEIASNGYGLYQVRSSQFISKLPGRQSHFPAAFAPSLTYTVHLNAWNCSCAAFAFSAFPATESGNSPWSNFKDFPDKEKLDDRERQEGLWAFGTMHPEHKKLEFPPICKHLLACFFAERWGSILGTYVKEAQLGREEIAAIACEA
ncbi:putative ubiquitin carboxyl-terminal hydrolase family protein [Erysiphe neolycopersici]|uniref:Putative ubiquitin carboxyl-terminal hydrolase family protein n=1 Tax=Erysiphe neolycopersici TaxID=212602 RepID=A0A420HRT1_9PEZI|nr:putative ubiquitin carboxyl-terminal hydrolase family protein [Erysiphe neolycopersici]